MKNKKHIGLICNHSEAIQTVHDKWLIEMRDVYGDVCSDCFQDNPNINTPISYPYDDNYNDNEANYWYDGTLKEYLANYPLGMIKFCDR